MPATKRRRSIKRARSVGFRKRGAGARTFKRRSVRRASKGRRAFKRKGSKKQAITWSDLGDRALLYTWVDEPTFVNASGALGQQCVWSQNTVASPNAAALLYCNLMLDDGLALYNMFRDAFQTNATVGNNQIIMRKSCSVSARIVNAETSTVILWEYRCIARRDQIVTPQVLLPLTSAVEDNLGGGLAAVVKPTVGTVVNGLYPMTNGSTPFMFHAFVEQYRIGKVRKWELKPGQVKHLKYSLKKPKMYRAQNIMSALGTVTATGGTAVPYVVRRGQAVSVFIAKGTFATFTSAGATYTRGMSNVNLGIEYKAHYNYTFGHISAAASGVLGSVPGFSANVAQAPMAMVINHPDSVITTIGTTNGIGTAGTTPISNRVYATASQLYVLGSAGQGDGIITDV